MLVLKRRFALGLGSVLLVMLAVPTAVLAATIGNGTRTANAPAPIVVNIGSGIRVTLNPSKAVCTTGATKVCWQALQLPLSDLTAASRALRRKDMELLSSHPVHPVHPGPPATCVQPPRHGRPVGKALGNRGCRPEQKHGRGHRQERAGHGLNQAQDDTATVPAATATAALTALREPVRHGLGQAQDDAAIVPAATAAPAVPEPEPTQCGFSDPEGYTRAPDRLTSCSDVNITDILFQIRSTFPFIRLLGVFQWEDQQWESYSASVGSWMHDMFTLGLKGFGDLGDGVTGKVSSSCDRFRGTCSAFSSGAPDPQPIVIAPGGLYPFGWEESDNGPSSGAAGEETIMDRHLGVVFTDVRPVEPSPARPGSESDVAHLTGRCDTMALETDGCVNEDFTPTLSLSLAQFGSSAAMVQWAQDNMHAHWGLQGKGQPLLRLANEREMNANRRVICQNGSFHNLQQAIGGDYGDMDSCDEFPFAGTFESGALNGVRSGAQCAQVTAKEGFPGAPTEALGWNEITVNSGITAAACVRGHIPGRLNSGVGGAYGRFSQLQRLIEDDPFWVSVTD